MKDKLCLNFLQAADLEQASSLWSAYWPEIIVLPISVKGQDVLPFIQTCLAHVPATQIVVIVNRDEINSAAKAMRAGVVDCLFQPFSSERLTKTILKAQQRLDATPNALRKTLPTGKKSAVILSPENIPMANAMPTNAQAQVDINLEEAAVPILPREENLAAKPQDTLKSMLRGQTLAQIERLVIESTIEAADGSVTQAAKILGVAPSTLYRKRQSWTDIPD